MTRKAKAKKAHPAPTPKEKRQLDKIMASEQSAKAKRIASRQPERDAEERGAIERLKGHQQP